MKANYKEDGEVYEALRNALAWDTIYEPSKDRCISTGSRIWNDSWGGYSMYCWDTYFAALLASIDNRELAYSNFIEMTSERTKEGFVPNYAAATGSKSLDRSQPPVASQIALELYNRYQEIWFLEYVFEDLFHWNQWFYHNRQIEDGMFAWGSNPFEKVTDNEWEYKGVDDRFGAALESGLDNSPMYDDIPFNKESHYLCLGDVGLTSLVLRDTEALLQIAQILKQEKKEEILHRSIQVIHQNFDKFWCEEEGMYLNWRTDIKQFSLRKAPTLFYALFNSNIPKDHIMRIIQEHFYNEKEFYGEWMLPSIARCDVAYKEQNYWRGRIWAPLNYLVYEALKKHDYCQDAAHELAEKSKKLILKEWLNYGHVHENYNADTGEGCDITTGSDRFYHWGALLSYIVLKENRRI